MSFSKKIPVGMKDYEPEECRKKTFIKGKLNKLFDSWGYDEVLTPTLEYYDTFEQCENSFKEEDMYKVIDTNGRILVMRPDMTIPISRFIVNKFSDNNETLRFRYCSEIYRSNKFYGGRQNEYTDCGVELIGNNEFYNDVEVLYLAFKALKDVNVTDFKIEIGHANIISGLLDSMKLSIEDKKSLEEFIDKKSMVDLESYTKKMMISDNMKALINELPWITGDIHVILEMIDKVEDEFTKKKFIYINNIYEELCKLGYGENIIFDLSKAPKPDYYSGIIFNAYIKDVGEKVLSGGRYDKLFSNFGVARCAVGFSINLDSIIPTLRDINNRKIEVEVDQNNSISEAILSTEKIRGNGNRVILSYKKK